MVPTDDQSNGKGFPMSTPKKTASTLVRFSVGADEIRLADAARDAVGNEAQAFRAFYDRVIVAHQLPFSAILPRGKDAERRTNEEQAAYDFALRMFWVYMFGADIAASMADRNVKGETILPISQFVNRLGKPYKDQSKRAIQSSFGGTPWKLFVNRLCEMAAADEVAAKVAAGEMTEAEAEASGKRGTSTRSSDREFVISKVGDLVKRLSKDIEKQDGSIAPDVASKLAAYLADGLKTYGIK
jgi:hypothetical protein